MVDLSGVDRAPSIVDRARAIILTPRDEWPRIAAETTPQGDILRAYVLPLAAIGPVAALIGWQVFGYGVLGFSWKPGIVWSLSTAIVSFVMATVSVFVLAFIANLLAPKFDGQSDKGQAFKLVAYSYTASWLAGIFGLIPSLAFFSLLGLYSFYLLYTGATPLMKVPQDKAMSYTVVTILCAIVLAIVVAPITAAITGLWAAGPMSAVNNEISGKLTVPGGGSVDLDRIQQATKQMEAAASGKSPPVAPDRMKALLPAAIGDYQRTATEAVAAGPMGSTTQGTYTRGDKSFTLRIADMSALGALSGLGAALGVEQSKEDANSYERTTTVGGQLQTESWDKTSNTGKFGVTVNNRFLIEAEGSAASVNELKQAVGAIDPEDLADLLG
ncbi:MAG: Yip1 family protein [Novosphingobium sp.]